jgi:hypothetical protein
MISATGRPPRSTTLGLPRGGRNDTPLRCATSWVSFGAMSDNPTKEVANPTNSDVPSVRVGDYKPNATSFTKESRAAVSGANRGRLPGTPNKLTRTMKDAAVEAANELGQLPLKQWAKQLNVGDPNGLKGYFKFLAVKHPKSFAVILARIMPLHVTTGAKKLPKYLTEEQMRSELRASGLPEDLIEFMHPVDVMSVDPDEVGDDPYPTQRPTMKIWSARHRKRQSDVRLPL